MRNTSILIAVLLLLAMTVSLASAAPSVTIVSPKNDGVISGSEVEISVTFVATTTQPVTRVQVNLDGKSVTERICESPLATGECGFLWDTVRTEDGQHRLDVQIFSGKVYLGMSTSVVTVANKGKSPGEDQPETPTADIKGPQVKIESPKEGETVSGKVPVIIQAKDNSGKSPFVSVFVDKSLKAVTNHEPFTYTWDSSQAENGPHEIHVSAMDDAENRSVTPPVRIIVRNASKLNPQVTEEPAAPIAETQVTSASQAESKVMPQELPAPVTESARTDDVATETFEVAQVPAPEQTTTPAPKVETVVTPPAPVSEPVQVALAPEPEVAVLVSGPAEYTLSAEPKSTPPVPAMKEASEKPVQVAVVEPEPKLETKPAPPVLVAAAKIDEPKKPVTTPMRRVEPKVVEYVVQSGDALCILAGRFGTTVDALVEANGLEDASLIRIGQKLQIPVRSGRTLMVPLRPSFDRVGGRMMWDSKKHSTHAWAPGTDVRVWIGSSRAEVNDRKVVLERPAALKSGRTMVPQSFVTETLRMAPAGGK